MLRVRIHVNGLKVVDEWITPDNVGSLVNEHIELCVAAAKLGGKWLVDIEDPDEPPETAHLRFGNDVDGITIPIPIDMTDPTKTLAEHPWFDGS